jgi:hypothetical protein
MPKTSWLDIVPTCTDVYVFQAALICEDCAANIMEKLDKQGVEDDGDSDTYPQGPHGDGGGEADSAQFCDQGRHCKNAVNITYKHRIGCPLGNPLTRDGAEAVRESVIRDLVSASEYERKVGRLLHRVWEAYTEPGDTLVRLKLVQSTHLPPTLVSKVAHHRGRGSQATVEPVVMCDSENAYLIVRKPEQLDLLRLPVNDDGNFTELEVASVPTATLEGYDPEKLLTQAIEELAWD